MMAKKTPEDTPEETPAGQQPTAEEQSEPTAAQAAEPIADQTEPIVEGRAVPTEAAKEIASVVEDAALEVYEENAERAEERAEASVASEQSATAADTSVGEHEEQADQDEGDEEAPAPRAKPSVPGAHLEVDIVPEGVDPLGRSQVYEDPYAVEDEAEQVEQGEEEDREETLSEPISTAAIDLASGARYRATGKRKTAIARVTLRPGSGTYLVNGRTLEEHFPRTTLQRNIRQPLETVGYQERMDVVARLHGGGISAQAGALRHGVSRALLEADPNLRGELKRRGFLTRDSRAKERKKAGLKKARKRPQFSKR
jgi:small subunit ribosomal protein S9